MYLGSHTSKYGNKRVGGFDSKRERDRFYELQLLQRAGQIINLQRQVKFELVPNQYKDGKCIYRKICYVADFTYHLKDGTLVVEDAKGYRTAEYTIKKKLMYFIYKIQIKET